MFTCRYLRTSILLLLVLTLFASVGIVSADHSGSAVFRDSNAQSDSLVISLTAVSAAAAGKQYEGWLVSNDGKSELSVGTLIPDVNGAISATYVDASGRDLANLYSAFMVTIEPSPRLIPSSSGDIAFAGSVTRNTMSNVRTLVVGWPHSPGGKAIARGLHDEIAVALSHANLAANSTSLSGAQTNSQNAVNSLDSVLNYIQDVIDRANITKSEASDDAVKTNADSLITSAAAVKSLTSQARATALLAVASTDLTVAQIHTSNVVARLNGTGMKDSLIVQSQNIATFVPTHGGPVLPSVGDPAAPRLALVALLMGLALTGIGGTFLLWRRFSTA